MKRRVIFTIILLTSLLLLAIFLQRTRPPALSTSTIAKTNQPAKTLHKVTVNEAARTLLYIPLYYALESGYFQDAGLDLQIVTGGTATTAFAAMVSGEADFAVADPMYVPIAQEKGGDARVIAQVVGRIAVWGVVKDSLLNVTSSSDISGKRIATHQKPMTAYTYTVKWLRDNGLDPDKDVKLVTGMPGSEVAALVAGHADVMFSLEPNTSRVVLQGGKVIYSFPQVLGDQIFSGLMTKASFVKNDSSVVESVVRAIQQAVNDLHSDPSKGIAVAKKFFPQVDEPVLKVALSRMVSEEVLPKSVLVSEESWDKAIAVRVQAGDLKRAFTREESCDLSVMEKALR